MTINTSRANFNMIAPVAQLAARRSHNPKVASSILAGSSNFFFCFGHLCELIVVFVFVRVAVLSVGWPSGPRR